MATARTFCLKCSLHLFKKGPNVGSIGTNVFMRQSNTLSPRLVDVHRHSKLLDENQTQDKADEILEVPRDFRFVHPEFMPPSLWYRRDKLTEYLERRDMYRRRSVMEIPEFYVGSIMAVTLADEYSPKKNSRFVGICIERRESGLRANFRLRNVVNGQGVEILYEMYNPLLQKIEVLKLEKRLDDQLLYLRDAPYEYSTFSFDLAPVPLPKASSVPVNTLKVKLNPRPWLQRWERAGLQGVEEFEVSEKQRIKAEKATTPWEKYDLMKKYRSGINEYDRGDIIQEFYKQTELNKPKTLKKKPLKQV
ncbi:hypothetical protein ScPMuIL_012892 [Solemya velum]